MPSGVKIWIDAQLSPALANWLTNHFAVEAVRLQELNLIDSSDSAIFNLARNAGAIILTKDRDFVEIGSSPWNSTTCHLDHVRQYANREMMRVLSGKFERACELLASGETMVEIKS
jgi:predicted nuclease of predicted toxin-antitoxin system